MTMKTGQKDGRLEIIYEKVFTGTNARGRNRGMSKEKYLRRVLKLANRLDDNKIDRYFISTINDYINSGWTPQETVYGKMIFLYREDI